MPTDPPSHASRREFVATLAGLGTAWALTDWAALDSALAHAAQAVARQPSPAFAVLTPNEAADLGAVAERIMPSDSTPGAREAGVIYFMDRAFQTLPDWDIKATRKDLRDLNKRAAKRKPGFRFAQLSTADQDAILKEIQNTPFFQGARFATLVGMFANPSWGGNRDSVGWKLIGFEPHAVHKPPFGYYDAQPAKGGRKS
jgi:gluconate 2-dehydrogenase gamma chain